MTVATKSPLRISLGGGGTDLPSYYTKKEGFCISAAIDKYVYIILHEAFIPKWILKYSQVEMVENIKDIEHPIIRESLKLVGSRPYLEIASMSDVPAGTGLGSSGSFTTALLYALYLKRGHTVTEEELAKRACYIEIDRLKDPVGKQDQYISAFGGIKCFSFLKDGHVIVQPLDISQDTLEKLNNNLLLFFTGRRGLASLILKDQVEKSESNNKEMINNLDHIKLLGKLIKEALENGNLKTFASLMDEHWQLKRRRSKGISDTLIDNWYDIAMNNGALGGKLNGAGGRGFLLFYTEEHDKLRKAMTEAGLQELKFKLSQRGAEALI